MKRLGFSVLIASVTLAMIGAASPAIAAAGRSVLIYGPSSGGGTFESDVATSLGYSVTVADDPTWAAMTTPDFAAFDAIVIADSHCDGSLDQSDLAGANATQGTWGAAVTGNVLVFTADPGYHGPAGVPAAYTYAQNSIAEVASGPSTGLYVGWGCRNIFDGGVSMDTLAFLGGFTVQGVVGTDNILTVDQTSPSMTGLNPTVLSNWQSTAHSVMTAWPAAFHPVAVSLDNGSQPVVVEKLVGFDPCLVPSAVLGTAGNDTINGTAANDFICGLGGNDVINGLDGGDTIYGGGGADIVSGNGGDDTIDGGSGIDTVRYAQNAASGVNVDLSTGVATGGAAFGTDTLVLGSIERIQGSSKNDTLTGDANANRIDGNGGNDTIVGGDGSDKLLGEGGNDVINSVDAIEGNDSVNGGAGADPCTTDPSDIVINCET